MIKNIIFDVGNVLLGYRWAEALADTGLSLEEANSVNELMFNNSLWVDFDAGNIDRDGLIEAYGKLYPKYKENIKQFLIHSERMPLARPKVWERVHRLKEVGYKIYLLSNYSEYLFNMHTANLPFMDDLDGRLVSYEVHRVKPDKDIYEILLSRYGLEPSESVFLDDRPENTATAQSLGIKSYTVDGIENICDILDGFIEERS